jgi:pimeloyl-ACP methyl ester carboxylesterase
MTQPTLHHISCPNPAPNPSGQAAPGGPGIHRMGYWRWGDAAAPHVVLCVHGLTRQGRDFDVIAQAIVQRGAGRTQVVCADVAGRGQSDWLPDPAGYQVPCYAMDMALLIAALKPQTLDWIGTSMGGLIGMAVCGSPLLTTIAPGVAVRRLVLNDVGPALRWEAIVRIGSYVGMAPRFPSVQAAADAFWAVSSSFGPHTPAQWLALSTPMVRKMEDAQGGYAVHYDPAIGVPFRAVTQEMAAQGEAMVWAAYDQITAQTLVLRGELSDLLSRETAGQMAQRGPQARVIEIAGVGHAPTLIATDQVQHVLNFLFAP